MAAHFSVSGTTVVLLLLMVGLSGCSQRLPMVPGPSEGGVDSATDRKAPAAGGATDLSSGIKTGGIEERERRVIEESMRREVEVQSVGAGASELMREQFLSEDIYFSYNSFTLLDKAKQVIEKKAEWLVDNPNVEVSIEGHCDERGTVAYNLALGERRANTVKQYLVALGIDAVRLTTISYGEEFALDPGHNEEAWARNRRAHFAILNP